MGRTERERERLRGAGGERAGDRGCAERRADNAPCARGTTVSKHKPRTSAAAKAVVPLFPLFLFFYSLFFHLLFFFLSADDGTDHRHFSEASRTTVSSFPSSLTLTSRRDSRTPHLGPLELDRRRCFSNNTYVSLSLSLFSTLVHLLAC